MTTPFGDWSHRQKEISKADTVRWSYNHYLNSLSYTVITKHGKFLRKVKHHRAYVGPQLAVVQFEGNSKTSQVPFKELKKVID